MRRLSLGFSLLFLTLVVVLLPACGSGDSGKIKLVAYSTPREAYAEIITAFKETSKGKNVEIDESYGASGEQARSVLAGLKADIAAFSLEPDMTKLVEAGLVDKSWDKNSYRGMVTNSIVVFIVRPGNPKKIKTWDDLLKPGVDVITPNPFTSGGAMWNVMAAYGSWLKEGMKPAEAVAKLEQLFRNVSVQNKSARESMQTFTSGKGDVLIGYENEAFFAKQSDQAIDYVRPQTTLLIENPVAVSNESADQTAPKAFLDFLYTPTAQRIYAKNGYRPVVKSVAAEFGKEFPTDLNIFTIDSLGGWAKVVDEFFDPESGTMAEIERAVGGSTG